MDFERNDIVFLNTLTNLRWLAIVGQSAAVFIGTVMIELELNIIYCLSLILASLIFNICSILYFPSSKRLSEKSILSVLMFDLLQLSALLYLCGGLTNPFAVLILAPVTIAATLLPIVPTVFLCISAVISVSILSYLHIPLELSGGKLLLLPDTLMFGIWAALLITIIFVSAYVWSVKKDMVRINELLVATKLALEREQKLTALGGLIAAAAHELGSPLTTIKLVSSELLEEFSGKSIKASTIEDLELIKSQAERCKEILKNMATGETDDVEINAIPIIALVKEASLPFQNLGKTIKFSLKNLDDNDKAVGGDQIVIKKSSEIVHGLRNIIQNATDFSKESVYIDVSWSSSQIIISVKDDGPGFPIDLIDGIGEPFINRKRSYPSADLNRPKYESMGLGLFIAKTLLERSGAKLTFRNYDGSDARGPRTSGAEVISVWNRSVVEETWS